MITVREMARNPWSVFDDLVSLQEDFNQFLDGQRWGDRRRRAAVFPPMNAYASEDGLIIDAEIPGVDLANIDIAVVGDQLTVKGRYPEEPSCEGEVYHRRERSGGAFERTVQLPFTADVDKVKATYRNGILRVTVPKSEAEKPRRIAITAG